MKADLEGKYDEFRVREFTRLFDEGGLSSLELVHYYLDRIARIDKEGPALNAVLHLDREAPARAAALDRERKSGRLRGPLHGIPILIKGNMNLASPGLPTTAGSLALRDLVAPTDAAVVAKLREAGAVILGSTNLSEWANFRSTRSTSGWSSEGGQVKNPYALDRNPSGSSSGSAVAVSANLCALAVGTETDGSIISPSSTNGIVGIKPSLGLVRMEGIIPIAASQDAAGPMARTMEDAMILLAAMVETGGEDLLGALGNSAGGEGLSGLRIGVARSFAGFHPEVDLVFEKAVETLRGLGAGIFESDIKAGKGLAEAELEVMLYEFKSGLERYLATYGNGCGIRGLSDLISYNCDHADSVMPWFGQEILLMAAAKASLKDRAYRRAKRTCVGLARTRGIDRSMAKQSLDALIAPSGGPAWKIDPLMGDHYLGGSASLAAIAGYPNLTLPAGFVRGLPVGLSIFGRAFSERKLCRIALAFESATRVRRKPGFSLPSP